MFSLREPCLNAWFLGLHKFLCQTTNQIDPTFAASIHVHGNSVENPNSEDPHNTDVSSSGIVGESDGLGSEAEIEPRFLLVTQPLQPQSI